LGNFEKARKVFRSPTRKEIAPKEVIKSEIEIRKTVEEKKMTEEDMKIIKEFMRDIKEELKIIRELKNEWRKREEKWERRIKEVEDKIERMITGNEDGDIQEKIKKLEVLEKARKRKEKRNNIIIKGRGEKIHSEKRFIGNSGKRNVKERT